ncbi:hypothetical protein [Streptomyces tendae]|uniref:hypothetical protein n=1 Tax=Streptomyces tendae TaxID=1932 RepID=UPI0037235942
MQTRRDHSKTQEALVHHQRIARVMHRAHPPRPQRQISCGKVWFADRIAADLVLAVIRSRGEARAKEPVRSYHCSRCHGWHLTSAPPRRDHSAAPKVTRSH